MLLHWYWFVLILHHSIALIRYTNQIVQATPHNSMLWMEQFTFLLIHFLYWNHSKVDTNFVHQNYY
jgi:hypothetical protein